MSEIITINALELASDLAHLRVLAESPHLSEGELWEEEEDSPTLVYKEEIQEEFNGWYEFYLDQITSQNA